MRLILVRHGETLENKKKIVQGQLQGTLSSEGKVQAEKLATRLRDEKITAIYTSDLQRALDTAKAIAHHHTVTVHHTKDLRERDFGQQTGKHRDELDWTNLPSDVETKEAMEERGSRILRKAIALHAHETVVFVGHSGINRAIARVILHEAGILEPKDRPQNTAVSIFELKEDKKHHIVVMNCAKHLKA